MFEFAKQIIEEKKLSATCEHETDFREILKLGVMSLPALVINEKVVSYGKVLSKEEIEKFMQC